MQNTERKDSSYEASIPSITVDGIPYRLEIESVAVRCNNCLKQDFTRVESKVSSNGKAWAFLCCIFGSCPLSLLFLCMDGFREFSHYCPSCNSMIGKYRPSFSGGLICRYVFLAFAILALQTLAILFLVLTALETSRNDNK